MPPPAGRGANPFSMVGKPLPTSFDAGVDLRDVQSAARHADPRTTPCGTTEPARTRTATRTTSSPPTWLPVPDRTRVSQSPGPGDVRHCRIECCDDGRNFTYECFIVCLRNA